MKITWNLPPKPGCPACGGSGIITDETHCCDCEYCERTMEPPSVCGCTVKYEREPTDGHR